MEGLGNSLITAAPITRQQQQQPEPVTPAKPPEDGKARAKKVDKFSRKAFPLAFLLFNIVYWLYYTIQDHAVVAASQT